MKVGFGSKGKKHKQKKGKKKGKQGKGDGDERMADVQHPGTPVKVADMEMNMQQPTAKDKQRQRMQLKRALKVTVAGLKSKRSKLTKLAGNKKPTEKKQLNKQIHGLLQGQLQDMMHSQTAKHGKHSAVAGGSMME